MPDRPLSRELLIDPPLCWCCATWGLTAPAIVADQRLCKTCLNSTRSECAGRHYDEALGITAEPQPDLFTTAHP